MESVIHTLVIIIFVMIPGFLFRRAYFQGGFSKQFDSKSWSHTLFYSIILGLFIEIITLYIFNKFCDGINSKSLFEFYTKISTHKIPEWILDVSVLKLLLYYFLVLLTVSVVSGLMCWYTVRLLKLDRRMKFLRFANHWHYYFKGEIKDFSEFNHLTGRFQCTNVDVLVNTEDGNTILYSGFLNDHTIDNSTGNLEALYLTYTRKYDIPTQSWRDIPGSVFIIPYSKVVNLNLRFVYNSPFQIPYSAILFVLCTILIIWDYYDILGAYGFFSRATIKVLVFFTLFNIFIIYSNFKGRRNPQFATQHGGKSYRQVQQEQTYSLILFLLVLGIIYWAN